MTYDLSMQVWDEDLGPKYPYGWLYVASLIGSVILLIGIFNGYLFSFLDAVLIAITGFIVVTAVGTRIAKPQDASWLPGLIAMGYLAKITLSTIRYLVLVEVYGGSGDATGYHGAGHRLHEVWETLQVPQEISIGTEFVDVTTGLLYVPYAPTMIGGFFIFATLAFVGQMFMYAAFRESSKPRRLKWYALALFFVPAISYWPSSIGKESLMFLGIGLAVYGCSLFLNRGGIVPLVPLTLGLGLAGAVRPHVAALIVVCLAVTLIFARGKTGLGLTPAFRWAAVLAVGAGSFFLISFAASEFNINLQGNVSLEVDEFVSNLEDNTSGGGSGVSGGAVTGPQDVPGAALRVLFRPLPYEAHNAQALASAMESAAILLVLIWRSPKILRNLLKIRDDPYVMMSAVMTLGFVIMFSPFLNLGLLARERSQILPFLAVVIIQLGWDAAKDREQPNPEDVESARPVSYA